MKAKELIETLQKLDPETLILVMGYEDGYCSPKTARQINVTGPHETAWYYGDYEDCETNNPKKIESLLLTR